MRATPPDRMRRAFLALSCALLAACVARLPSPPSLPADVQAPADFPQAYYLQAAANGKTVLQVKPEQSLIAVEVRRGGMLAGLGHDHLVASRDVRGLVLPSEGREDLYLPLSLLTVDEAGLRAEAGMDTKPNQDAIEGTRRNMLEKVLEADRFPFALVRITREDAAAGTLKAAITLHGQTRMVEAPARIEGDAGRMIVSGRLAIAQSDFGITPFSVLGGALQVQDRLEIRYRIAAENH
ncbi:MAG TPA: YceI family protein [Noviherbaspirillum sp.]|nr:YceI family protein [Noviherbaspirillum sp.]